MLTDEDNDKECRIPLHKDCAKTKVDIYFRDLAFSVRDSKGKWKKILRSVSGEFRSGRLTAILGPSGAGKTTLLNLVSGRVGSRRTLVEGTIETNDKDPDVLNRHVCYVPQSFTLLPLLTTKETLHVAAKLKLPKKTDNCTETDLVIERVAASLGLTDCMSTLCCDLSGGEQKRLSIAVETITNPAIMLLDEPTSGLDSASSEQVISLLRSISRTGCTVVCSVHQPSSRLTGQFDDLLIMSRGKSRYYGQCEDMFEYFKVAGYSCPPFYNISEFVLEVVSGQRGGNHDFLQFSVERNDKKDGVLYSSNLALQAPKDGLEEKTQRYAVSSWEQHKVLVYRAVLCMSRDKTLTLLRLAAHIVVGILIGLVFYNFGDDAFKVPSNIACLFFFCIFLYFANAMPNVQMFPVEAKVFLQENSNNWYSLTSYYVAKVLTDLPLQILCPTTFLMTAYPMTGQPLEIDRIAKVWLICLLLTFLAQLFGVLIGAAFDTHAGMFLVPATNIPMFLFAGFFLKLKEVPTYLDFVSNISYFRYAFEGLMQAVYTGRERIPCSVEFCYFRPADKILEEFDMPSCSFQVIILVLFSWIVLLHLSIYKVLWWKIFLSKR